MSDPPKSEVGYRKPPRATRFVKGRSGNPKGRPRGRRSGPPYEAVLGQMVTIREAGTERRVTAAEAFLLKLTKQSLEGKTGTAQLAMKAIEEARERSLPTEARAVIQVSRTIVSPGSVTSALEPLRMGRIMDCRRASARVLLEPWIVEMALERLRARSLSTDEQRTVVEATRTPWKVRWPGWWEVEPPIRKCGKM